MAPKRNALVRIEIDADAFVNRLQKTIEKYFGDSVDVLNETAEYIRETMSRPGAPITRPVKWDTQKQKRAFFASNGFGGGIPHVRKMQDGYIGSWKIVRADTRGKSRAFVSSDYKGAPYIGGTMRGYQSRIHKGRWNQLKKVVNDIINDLPKRLRDKFSATGRTR
jgi:hypothetical protein